MRETFIGGIRNYIGPGHRGKSIGVSRKGIIQCSSDYRPRINVLKGKNVELHWEQSIKLGFMNNKHTVFIPQVLYSVDRNINIEKRVYTPGGFENPKNNLSEFFKCLKKLSLDDAIRVNTEFALYERFIIIGCFYNKWFYYANVPLIGSKDLFNTCIEQNDKQDLFISLYSGEEYDFSYKLDGGLINGELQFICLKTAFNVLASVKGQEYVIDSRFDAIRNIIIGNSSEEILHNCDPCKATRWISNLNVKEPHVVIFETIDRVLFSVVSFYGELTFSFMVASDIDDEITFAYVCDWRNKNEYVVQPWQGDL